MLCNKTFLDNNLLNKNACSIEIHPAEFKLHGQNTVSISIYKVHKFLFIKTYFIHF